MKVLIDADACPVVEIAVKLCRKYNTACILMCDTAHEFHLDGAQTLVNDKGDDSVDFALVNKVDAGDLVITQDYGLASMCLAKNATVLHQDGWAYTQFNIDALLFQRYATKEYRAKGGRIKGPKKRSATQNDSFAKAMEKFLQQAVHG